MPYKEPMPRPRNKKKMMSLNVSPWLPRPERRMNPSAGAEPKDPPPGYGSASAVRTGQKLGACNQIDAGDRGSVVDEN